MDSDRFPGNYLPTVDVYTAIIYIYIYIYLLLYIYTNLNHFRLFGNEFNLATNGESSTERDCDTLNLNAIVGLNTSVLINRDYLLIPDGVSIDAGLSVFASKYCGNSLKGLEVNSKLIEFFFTRVIKYIKF